MVDRRNPSPSEALEHRFRRIELMIAALILGSTEAGDYRDDLHFLLRRIDDFDDERWLRFLISRLSRTPRTDQYEHIWERLNEFERSSEERYRSLEQELERTRILSKGQQRDLHAFLAATTLEIPLAEARLRQFLPVRVYMARDDEAATEAMSKAVEQFLEAFGLLLADDLPPEHGSWFKRWFAKSSEFISRPEFKNRVAKAERALELELVHNRQANVNKQEAEAAATLLAAIENDEVAVCQIGSLFVIRVNLPGQGRRTYVRTLSPREITFVEQNQDLLKQPERLLEKLSSFNCHQAHVDSVKKLPTHEDE